MSVKTQISDFFIWWFSELQTVFIRLFKSNPSSADISIRTGLERTLFPVSVQYGGGAEPFHVNALDELESEISRKAGRRNQRVQITLGPGRFIRRIVAPMRLPASHRAMMAAIDCETNTPFARENVYLGAIQTDHDTKETACAIIKKSELDPVLGLIRRNRLRLTGIHLVHGETATRLTQDSLATIQGRTFRTRLTAGLVASVAAALFVGAIATVTIEARRIETASNTLDTLIAEARTEAKRTRERYEAQLQLLQQTQSIRADKDFSRSTVFIWNELTRIVPDHTWLTDFSIEEGFVTISGYSASAASLITLLENADIFSTPEFKSSIVKAPGIDAERFTLQAQLETEPDT